MQMNNSKYVELTRNIRENQLGGVIFGCKHDTIDECFRKQLFGLPSVHYSYVRNVKPGMPLFLFNYSDRKLHGIFEAASPGEMYIDSYAWSNDGSLRTAFPAQVRICTKTQYPPLLESQFKTLLGDNYYNHHHFYFELDHAQTRALISLFKSLAPSNFIQVPAVSSKRNLAVPDPKKVTANSKETNPFSVLSNTAAPFNWADDVDNASNTDEKKSDDSVSDYDNLDDNLLQNQFGPHSNPDEVSQTSSGKTVGQGLELIECNHPVVNTVNDKRIITDESMLLNSHNEHNGPVEVDEVEIEVHNNPGGGVGLQPERQTVLEKLKGLSFLRQQEAITSKDCTDSGSDQCVPDETQINPNLLCGPFDATMEDKISFDECHGNAEVLQIITDLQKRTEALEKKLIGSDKELLSLREIFKDSGRKVQQLEYIVDELQFKLDSSLAHLGNMCNTLATPSIFLIGGYNGVTWLSSLDSFSPEKDAVLGLTPMSSPRSYASAAVLDGHIFAIGGGDGMSWYNTVECYSSRNNEWTECPSLNQKKGSLAGICLNEKIYAIGGGDGNEFYSEVEIFDPYLGKWICSPSMLTSALHIPGLSPNLDDYSFPKWWSKVVRLTPKGRRRGLNSLIILAAWEIWKHRNNCVFDNGRPCISDLLRKIVEECKMWCMAGASKLQEFLRFALAAAGLNGVIYTSGGYDGNMYLESAERYDPREGFWVRLPSMSTRRGCHTLTVLGDTLYAMGGYDGDKMVSSVEIYDPRLNAWRMGDSMNTPRGYAAAVYLDDSLFLIGGMQSSVQMLDTVEVYNASSGWSVLGFSSIGMRSFASAVVM